MHANKTVISTNAQKSTGPRTAIGKAISSANALKSGLYSESHVVKGESAAGLDTLTAEYYAGYRPTTAAQRALVDTLTHNEWLLRRLRRVETDLWNQGIEFIEERKHFSQDHLLADTFSNKQETLARLQRRIDSLDRAYHRALKALRQLQSEELPADPVEAPPVAAQPISPQRLPPAIGFVPSPSPAPHLPPSSATSMPRMAVRIPHDGKSGLTEAPLAGLTR
jgi:hypothetical protein